MRAKNRERNRDLSRLRRPRLCLGAGVGVGDRNIEPSPAPEAPAAWPPPDRDRISSGLSPGSGASPALVFVRKDRKRESRCGTVSAIPDKKREAA